MNDLGTINLASARSLPITDTEGLKLALQEANLPSLLMVYTTYTQDEAYLDRFRPYLTGMFTANALASIPDDLADDLRERLFALLTDPNPPEEKPLDSEFLRKMMSVSVGEDVDPKIVPVLYDQMGFEQPVKRKDIPGRKQPQGFKVLIIGGGMTGIAAGIKLTEAGYDYTIIEKNPELGGTWWENRYPGVGVDTPSHFYSYSFELNPDWSTYHPKGGEVQDYLVSVADKYGIRKNVQFETTVSECRWDDAKDLWHVTLRDKDGNERVEDANAVLFAHGVLNRWSMPNIPGLDTFKGPKMHSAGWDPTVDLKGKKVALIGTGASAAQIAPAVAGQVDSLVIFQRSKHWVLNSPERNADEVTEGVHFALRNIPHYKEWFRFRVYWFTGDGLYPNVKMEPNWPTPDISISPSNHAAREYALGYIRNKLKDRPDLLEKIVPDFPIFSKRIVLDNDGGWLDTLLRPNVTLETDPIDHIEENAVVTKNGTRYEADVLALATGFDLSPSLGPIKVYGRNGADLSEAWGFDDPRAYLGVMAPAYPNLFMTLGPNSAPNHAAGVNMVLEAQIHYIIEALDRMVAEGGHAIEPTMDAYNEWNQKVEDQMQHMIWSHPKAKSYYLNSKGRNYVSCPFMLAEYWTWTRQPDEKALVVS